MQLHEYEYADYLSLEHYGETKHEFVDGEIYAITGGTPRHALLAAEVLAALRNQLGRGECRVFTSDLRVRVQNPNVATYPDVSVICGEPQLDPDDARGHGVLNPTVLVEVTSTGTERYDRGRKLEFYKTIPSLRAVVLVSHREASIEVHARGEDDAWSVERAGAGGAVDITAIGCRLDVDEIYSD